MIVVSCLLYEVMVRTVKNALFPTDIETFQQLERDPDVRRQFEEASASELQAGWLLRDAKSVTSLEREDLLKDGVVRPRVLEEGRNVVETQEQVVMVEDGSRRRSNDIQEMLSRRFGSIRGGELKSSVAS